jgi:hypothetical protein
VLALLDRKLEGNAAALLQQYALTHEHYTLILPMIMDTCQPDHDSCNSCRPKMSMQSCTWSCLQVLSMVRGLTAPELYAATEHNLHEFAVNVRPTILQCPQATCFVLCSPEHGACSCRAKEACGMHAALAAQSLQLTACHLRALNVQSDAGFVRHRACARW